MLVRFTSQVSIADIERLTRRCETVGVQYKLIQEMGTSYLAIESVDRAKIDELYYQLRQLPIVEALVRTGTVDDPLAELEPVKFKCGSKRVGKDSSPTLFAGSPYLESQKQAHELAGELAAIGVHIYKAGPYRPTASETLSPKALYERTAGIVRDISSNAGIPSTGMIEVLGPKTALALLQACALHVPGRFLFESNLRDQLASLNLPVLLERHPQASTELWLECAGTIASAGNPNVALVETGVQGKNGVEIDLVSLARLIETCPLPVIVYSSRAASSAEEVRRISRGALGSGVAGIMIDVHPNPLEGLLTEGYCLSLEEFHDLFQSLRPLLV
jgi:3-deoxy-7-phosphoheptulonate synthase